jgi:hypothetical protein
MTQNRSWNDIRAEKITTPEHDAEVRAGAQDIVDVNAVIVELQYERDLALQEVERLRVALRAIVGQVDHLAHQVLGPNA